MNRVIKDVGGKALWTLETLIARASLVPNTPFLDPKRFSWIQPLEFNWMTIRRELETIMRHPERIPRFQDVSADQASITSDNKWRTYFLYGMGYKAERNAARCPETTRLVEQIPGMKTAFFSILHPHKHIPEHRGLYKGFLRYHLGLQVPGPSGACRIRVANETRRWEEGKSLMFDDTYPHEAWNDSDGARVVLFLDILRPLRFPVSALNKTIVQLVRWSPYVQDARKNQERWDRDAVAADDDATAGSARDRPAEKLTAPAPKAGNRQ